MSRLSQASCSGYYRCSQAEATRFRREHKRQKFLDQLDRRIRDVWEDSDEVYGAPRITAELVDKGIMVNRKTVANHLRMMGIEGISPRAFVSVTTIQSKQKSSLADLVKRLLDQGRLNRAWMSDITYLRTGEGWLYLCAIRDGHSRGVLGWAMDSVQDSHLVERSLRMACTLRGDVSDELVFRAGSGTQFTSRQLWQVCQELGTAQSVGRPVCALITRCQKHFGRR